jgi:hypothetical protein
MRKLMMLSLILIVLFAGCVEQEISITGDIKDGVVIKEFSFDSSTVYGGDRVGLNLEIQNIGEVYANITDISLFGPEWATDEINPSPNIIGVELRPSEPELDFEGDLRYTRWILKTPEDIRTGTEYSVGTRVVYDYETKYMGTIRIVTEDYLETLPEEERVALLESSGVISASTTGGPLSVSPVKGRNFVVSEGYRDDSRPIRFKVTNVGSGYTYTDDIGDYQVYISSEGKDLSRCGVVEDSQITNPIKLSKGKDRIFSCNFKIPKIKEVPNRVDKPFSITFDYNYYVDGMTSINVEPTGEEIPSKRKR